MAAIEYLTVDHLSTKDLIRIFSKILINPSVSFNGIPCWLWTGTPSQVYSSIHFRGKYERIHRLMFAWLVHPLPRYVRLTQVDHLCRRPRCCNPSHLEYVTAQVNTLRSNNPSAKNSQRTHCKKGHHLDRVKTTIRGKSRYCSICRTEQARKDAARNPERIRQNQKRYKEKHRDRIREIQRRSKAKARAEDPEKARAYAREYRQRNLIKMRAKDKERYQRRRLSNA